MKTVKTLKPMLAPSKTPTVDQIKFPVAASFKLDGIRALMHNGVLVSRTFKPIPNRYLQKRFADLPEGQDGELICGDPWNDPYRRTVSAVMSEDGEPDDVHLHTFDNFAYPGGFNERFLKVRATMVVVPHVKALKHITIETIEELDVYEAEALATGYEGLMIRSIDGPYKFGRCTIKEGYLMKIKRFMDSEAEILSCYELMHNENEAEKDAFGRTKRSTAKDGLVAAGILGGFEARDIHTGVEFKIGGKFTLKERQDFWKHRDTLLGRLVKYKFFPTGGKDKPRFPVFLGFRDKIDL